MTKPFLEWLKQLIINNQMEKFYHCKQWLEVAEEVKKIDNYECQECKRKGVLTTKTTKKRGGTGIQMSVHHHKEVRQFPELALSIYYTDSTGTQKRNLEYLCEHCHRKIHGRYGKGWQKSGGKNKKNIVKSFMNEEMW